MPDAIWSGLLLIQFVVGFGVVVRFFIRLLRSRFSFRDMQRKSWWI